MATRPVLLYPERWRHLRSRYEEVIPSGPALCARYNADLSAEGLSALGCGNMDPERVQELDAVDQVENLLKIGLSAGEKIKLEHFGSFAQQAAVA